MATTSRAGPTRTLPMSPFPIWTRPRSANSSRRSGAAEPLRPSLRAPKSRLRLGSTPSYAPPPPPPAGAPPPPPPGPPPPPRAGGKKRPCPPRPPFPPPPGGGGGGEGDHAKHGGGQVRR